MYEAEVNDSFESIDALPPDIRKRFAEIRDRIVARTVLPWGEHCTECAWPTCYTTCDLYSPKEDGNCRLFVDGMVRIDNNEGPSPYLLKIRFKRWGKLWTVGNLHLQSIRRAALRERFNMGVGAIARNLPVSAPIKPRLLRKVSYLRRRSAENSLPTAAVPDCFLLECYNPSADDVALRLTVRSLQMDARPFQTLVVVSPGYARSTVAFSDISQAVDLRQPFEVEIVPNGGENTVLYFGLMDFVKTRVEPRTGVSVPDGATWKCIVWDLDNTLWDGVLIEDGPEALRIRQEAVEVIRQTDQRGILHSIASKNDHADAMRVLASAGLDEYFLHPQIMWRPKSESIAEIARLLNIGVDAVAFVDDQPFEREEVKGSLAQVAVIDAAHCGSLLARPECSVPVTAESRNRRAMYREQERRQSALECHHGDYLGFLKTCRLEIDITPLDDTNLTRVYELAQRTNQLNFSGHRYPEATLAEIARSAVLETYVIACTDRFGSYGIVGFAIVDLRGPRLVDLMFSCRIQGKRVEHAILSHLLERFVEGKHQDFHADYRPTSKNAPAGSVFREMGFETVAESDGVVSLVFKHGRPILDDGVIRIRDAAVNSV
jgi:FkbH-like protein